MAAYTDTQKSKAVDLYLKHGTAEAARQTGISGRTITRWASQTGTTVTQAREQTNTARQELARRTAERRERIRTKILERAEDLIDRMETPKAGDVRNLSIAFAVLIDKYRLEMGEATNRAENVTIDQAVSRMDEEIADMLSQLPDADRR